LAEIWSGCSFCQSTTFDAPFLNTGSQDTVSNVFVRWQLVLHEFRLPSCLGRPFLPAGSQRKTKLQDPCRSPSFSCIDAPPHFCCCAISLEKVRSRERHRRKWIYYLLESCLLVDPQPFNPAALKPPFLHVPIPPRNCHQYLVVFPSIFRVLFPWCAS